MGETDTVKNTGQPKDVTATLRWVGWLIEKVGVPWTIVMVLLFVGGKKFDELGVKLDRIVSAMETRK